MSAWCGQPRRAYYVRAVTVQACEETRTATAGSGVEPATLGAAAHRLIAELLDANIRRPNVVVLRRHVATHPAVTRLAQAHRQPAKQILLSSLASYFRFFVPDEHWALVGSEVVIGGNRADLVWSDGERVLIDELKAGRIADRFERASLRAQVIRLQEAALIECGSTLLAVRALVLAAPASSYTLFAAGETAPLEWERR